MFKNWTRDLTLELMEKSDIEFYLTGSRFFGRVNSLSDFDFFTQDSQDTRDWLRTHGFVDISGKYSDSQTMKVLRKGGVDIQLVKDVRLKAATQERLKRITDSPTKQMWEFAFKLIYKGE